MRTHQVCLASALVLGAGLAAALGLATRAEPASDLTVHEWGTFLAMSGSDGVSLEGMYHEEHALPAFVHARSRDQLRLPSVVLKGETPVIYFYTERAQDVRVDVRFPKGLWTQWYPQAQVVGPPLSQPARPGEARGGHILWCARLRPSAEAGRGPRAPETSADALWNFARQVDAADVVTRDRTRPGNPFEAERFLFYRGLGEASLPIRFAAAGGGTLESAPGDHNGVRHLFVVRVEGGQGAYSYRPALAPGERIEGVIPALDRPRPMAEFTRILADDLAARLVESGLYPAEARAMVNTWTTSYFQADGIRALFVLPREWTDATIPLEIEPRPRQVVRVMVGRIELLTPGRERLAEAAIADLAAPDRATRARAFETLRDQGRYVEPIIRRVLRTSPDEAVRTLCRRLLLTDFVTELRAAIHGAADGRRVVDDPVFVRAQLALLLREIGLAGEAKAEGAGALATLRDRAAPPIERPDARHYLRANARGAAEAVGDDRTAAAWYGRFIDFAGQVATKQDCRGCHRDAGPTDLSWFRDWWAGRRYAALLARLGEADRVVAAQASALQGDPLDAAARMKLAYLHEGAGDRARAEALWASFEDLARPGGRGVGVPVVHRADSP